METFNILFLCTGNSARSILGEVIATQASNGRFIGYSAGSNPVGTVNPHAMTIAEQYGYDLTKLRSNSWQEFSQEGAPVMDFVITVCDDAAGEVCPIWPGQPVSAHWSFPDPAKVEGSEEEIRWAFMKVEIELKKRIEILANLPLESLDEVSLTHHLKKISH